MVAAASFDGGHATTSQRTMRGQEDGMTRGQEGGATRGNTTTSLSKMMRGQPRERMT